MHKLYEITRAKDAATFLVEENSAAFAPEPDDNSASMLGDDSAMQESELALSEPAKNNDKPETRTAVPFAIPDDLSLFCSSGDETKDQSNIFF